MAPFARIRARITSSFRKAKGILAKIIYGEYFYDFNQQTIGAFTGGDDDNRIENSSPTKPEFTFGNALKFDGVNDYVSFTSISNGDVDFSVSFWVKFGIAPSGANIALLRSSSSSSEYIGVFGATNIRYNVTTASNFTVPNMVIDTWYHIVFTYQSGFGMRCYFDGVESVTGILSGVKLFKFDEIGRYATSIYGPKTMDEISIYSQTLTPTQVSNLYNLGSGNFANVDVEPLVWFNCNEADGETTLLNSGIGGATYNGTLNNFNFDGTDGFVRHGYYKELSPYTGIAGGFNGVSSFIDATDVLPEIADSTNGLIFARVYIEDATPTALQVIVSVGDTGSNARLVVAINATDGKLRVFCSDGSTLWYLLTDTQALQDQTWHTIAVLQDGVSPVLYVDGVAPAQTFNTSTDTTGWFADCASVVDNFYIGKRHFGSANGNFWDGYIADVLIIDGEINATQIAQLHNNPEFTKTYLVNTVGITWSNVKAWYPLTENGGTTAYDYSDNANHGTWTNAAYSPVGLPSVRQLGLQSFSKYTYFDGVDDVINVNTPITLSQGTIALWIRPLQSNYNRVISADGSSNLSYINPRIGSSQLLVRINNNSNQMFFTDPLPMVQGGLYHIAVTFNSTTASCFINGIACAENPFTIPVPSNTFQVYNLGRLWQTANYGKQIIDDVAVWDTELTQANIVEIYGGALASNYSPENLQLYYKDCVINSDGVFKDISGNNNNGTPAGSPETIVIPEKETISDIPYDGFGLECNFKNTEGVEQVLNLNVENGYVFYDGHAGSYTDIKQIQFMLKTSTGDLDNILTDESDNRIVYLSGNQIVSDLTLAGVYINDIETDIILTDTWVQVTMELSVPVDIAELYIGVDAPTIVGYSEFYMDKLNFLEA